MLRFSIQTQSRLDILNNYSEIAFKWMPQDQQLFVSIGSDRVCVPLRNTSLPEPILTKSFDVIWRLKTKDMSFIVIIYQISLYLGCNLRIIQQCI